MEEPDLKSRKEDWQETFEFRNHKGATQKPELLKELVGKDSTHGYGSVLHLKKLKRIPGSLLAPMNIQKKNTIDEHGRIAVECGSHTFLNGLLLI